LQIGFATYRHYRAYLSQSESAFIHIATTVTDPKKILECRLYQPYKEIGTGDIIDGLTDKIYNTAAEAAAAGWGPDHSWEFWMLDNPDPAVGGFLGCPVMVGKDTDNTPHYQRSWVANNARINPIIGVERLLHADGHPAQIEHQMMHYGRALSGGVFEYMMVSKLATDVDDSLMMWIGLDIKPEDLTISAA
jgi:hypothetical protein